MAVSQEQESVGIGVHGQRTKLGGCTWLCFRDRMENISGGQVYCVPVCAGAGRGGGSEFRLWVCVICVGGGIWAGERNLCMRGRGRVCEMTHIFQPVGGFICWG